MKRPRIIPLLSIIENRLVKTRNFKSPKYIGDPLNAIKIFNDKFVDEISVIDIRASQENKNPNFRLIEDMASECFMPISYGGGINSFAIAKRIFEMGVDKIILNSACYKNIELVKEISSVFGSQSIVVSVDYSRNIFGKINFISRNKKQKVNITSFLNELEKNGMGELMISCINNEGCFNGYDYSLCSILEKIRVPVIINGGLSSINDIKKSFQMGFDAAAGSSFFIYQNNNKNSILINYPNSNQIKTIS